MRNPHDQFGWLVNAPEYDDYAHAWPLPSKHGPTPITLLNSKGENMYRIYTEDKNRPLIAEILNNHFPQGFTMIPALGYSLGEPENSLVIELEGVNKTDVLACAQEIQRANSQDSVLVSWHSSQLLPVSDDPFTPTIVRTIADAYGVELARQNSGHPCAHCGSTSGHTMTCPLINREMAELAAQLEPQDVDKASVRDYEASLEGDRRPTYRNNLDRFSQGFAMRPTANMSAQETEDELARREANRPYDILGGILKYEQDGMTDDEMTELFQHLVDTGMAWELQGHYGRTAKRLIDAGVVHMPARHSQGFALRAYRWTMPHDTAQARVLLQHAYARVNETCLSPDLADARYILGSAISELESELELVLD